MVAWAVPLVIAHAIQSRSNCPISGSKWDSRIGASFRPAHFFVAITFNGHAPDSEVLEHGDAEVWHRACLAVVALFGRSSLDLGRPQGWPLFCVIPVFDPRPDHRCWRGY